MIRMMSAAWAAVLALSVLAVGPAIAQQGQAPKAALAEPALSPDGREIAFVSGGDIWTVPAAGGVARLLVSDPATESRPIFSPDGTELAFTSTRNGPTNVYVLTLASGAVRRLTFTDGASQLDAWSRDGKWIYFSSAVSDIAGQNDIFRVSASGGTPLEVSRERFLNEFNAAPSPDGKTLALMAKGMSSTQWWRNGHSHIDEAELWLKPVDTAGGYRRLLAGPAKRLWPMWRPDGAALYFMSDEGGSENLWRVPTTSGRPEQLTRFTSGRVLWPQIALDGSTIVFERDFAIWKLDLKSGEAAPVKVDLRGSPAGAGQRRLNETNFQAMALSPDGKKVAVIAHGEVFTAPAKDGGPAQRMTQTVGPEDDLDWAPDSRRLAYVSQRGLVSHVMEYDFVSRTERALTTAAGAFDVAPVYSPDGKMLAYIRNNKELRLISFGEGDKIAKDVLLATGVLADLGSYRPAWSPDSRWLAYGDVDAKSFRNVWVVPAAGGKAQPVSFLANGNTASTIAWSKDGKYLVFETAQRSEDTHLVRVDLLPHVPKYREDEFNELFKPSEPAPPATEPKPKPATTPAALPEPGGSPSEPEKADKADKPAAKPDPKATPVRIVFEGIRERATLMPLGLSADEPVISPDGKTLLFRASVAGVQTLYSYDLDELAKEPPVPQQVLSNKRAKRAYAFTPDSKTIFLLDGGTVTSTPLETPRAKAIEVTAEMDAVFEQEKLASFDQAWNLLDRFFFDEKFNGRDWSAARTNWRPYIAGAKTPDEMRRLINLMIGELNASHSGINRAATGFGSAPAPRVGDLGLRFDREAYERGRGLVVREIVALGPVDIEGSIKVGDVLTAVDGRKLDAAANLDRVMLDKIGKRVVLSITSGPATREVVVRPVSSPTAAGLLYRDWVGRERAYVERISGGRLGYVHLADMSQNSLNQLYLDLDAQNQGKDGVVVDVRNNNGGFVNGHALDVFARRNYMTMTERGGPTVPSRQALGQRALGTPTILLTNESSLSDAEDFTEGYRTLGLGKVVGVPTAGWIIFTSNVPLIDGSVVRVPLSRIRDAKGQDMEMHPRPVDITVERQLGETLTGRDSQLDAAVAELLKALPARRAAQ
jgi:tricorn protease